MLSCSAALAQTGESVGNVISRLAAAATASPPNSAPGTVAVASRADLLEAAMMTFLSSGTFSLSAHRDQTIPRDSGGTPWRSNRATDAALVAANGVFGGRIQFGSEADVANWE